MANTIESRTVKNIVTWLLTLFFAIYSLSSTLPTAYGMMQVVQTKEGETKSKLYSIYGYVIEGKFVKEEDQFIYFRDSKNTNYLRKINKAEIFKLILPDGTIYLENNSLKATYERNLSLRAIRMPILSNNTIVTAWGKNVHAWKNESLIVNFRDGSTKTLYQYLFISGKDFLAEDTLLYKRGSYIYKTPVNKISTYEVKRFNKEESLSWTILIAVVGSIILGAIVHREVHCHHGEGTECE